MKKYFYRLFKLFRQKPPLETKGEKKTCLKTQALLYFENDNAAKDEVLKACYAWHDDIEAPGRHVFQGYERSSKCISCGQTREEVRYGKSHPRCPSFSKTGPVGFHRFGGSAPWATCVHCGETRENLNDSIQTIPGGYGFKLCPCYQEVDILKTIREEEGRFSSLLERAKTFVPKITGKRGMSGETLAFLHRTHGFDVETVASVVEVTPEAEAEYEKIMEDERSMSRGAFRPKPIQAA